MSEKIFPCVDIADKTEQLQLMGYQVLGSSPTPGMAGFCTLRYQYPVAALVAAPSPAAASAATLEPLQQRAAQAIVNIFETGEVRGKYGEVTLINGDSGHLSFGRSQTTLKSGNLWNLIAEYCKAEGARFAARLKPYLPKLHDRLEELDNDQRLLNLLRASADDPVMRDVQDKFFDKTYWEPAVERAAEMQIRSALGIAVVYDSTVHGSWEMIRDRTIEQFGAISASFLERDWIKAYIKTRRAWLANHERPDLRRTVYRMNAFQALVDHDSWSLELPLSVRDREISLTTLLAAPPGCYDGPEAGSRPLAVTTPFARGADVRLVQLGLSDAGIGITADGVYGNGSAAAIKQYQAANALASTGVADKALIAQLTKP